MGASASIVASDSIPEEMKELFTLIEKQQTRIAEADSKLLESEVIKMFKNHNKIIDDLTSRSKSQIQFMLSHFPTCVKHLDTLFTAGNPYAKFITQLAIPKEEIEIQEIIDSGEYDEELLVNIIGTSTIAEIQNLDKLFIKHKSFGLADLFATKTKEDSVLKKFLLRILRYDRDEGKETDVQFAASQAEILHKAGAARLLGVDEDAFVEILGSTSRVQCYAINEVYQRQYKMKLERAINMKFKGNASKLLVLWSQPIPAAIATSLQYMISKMIVNKESLSRMLAKYDKDLLSVVSTTCQQQHQKSLADVLSSGISGTLHRAYKNYIESPSPDKGFLRILSLYLDGKTRQLAAGTAADKEAADKAAKEQQQEILAELLSNPDSRNKIHFLLEKAGSEMRLFMIDHKMKLDPSDTAVLAKSSSSLHAASSSSHLTTKTPSSMSLREAKSSANLRGGTGGKQGSSLHMTSSNNLTRGGGADAKGGGEDDYGGENVIVEEGEDGEEEVGASSRRRVAAAAAKPLPVNKKKFSLAPTSPSFSAASSPTHRHRHHRHEEDPEKNQAWINETYAYLLSVFEDADLDGEGSLAVDNFWAVMKGLPLPALGFSEEEIDSIQVNSAWDQDGQVYYYEALMEFSVSVVSAIQEKEESDGFEDEDRDVPTVIAKLVAQKEMMEDSLGARVDLKENFDQGCLAFALFSSRRNNERQYPDIPMEFRQYVVDTITAFDFDCNGFLTTNETSSLIETMGIGMVIKSEDFFTDKQNYVQPKAASEMIFKIIQPWFKDEQDHYICLIDANSGAYFWFNTKDQSSQWVDYNAAAAGNTAAAVEGEAAAAAVAGGREGEVEMTASKKLLSSQSAPSALTLPVTE